MSAANPALADFHVFYGKDNSPRQPFGGFHGVFFLSGNGTSERLTGAAWLEAVFL
jgi:hypothetical protein